MPMAGPGCRTHRHGTGRRRARSGRRSSPRLAADEWVEPSRWNWGWLPAAMPHRTRWSSSSASMLAMIRYASEFGLTAAARARLSAGGYAR